MSKKSKVLLCILDGWGVNEGDKDFVDATKIAHTPFYDHIIKNSPNSLLSASSINVGLPEGQIGNSEVGHCAIGAGRVIYQDLPRVNNYISEGFLSKNSSIKNLIDKNKKNKSSCHLVGMLSDGGVHSYDSHIFEVANLVSSFGIKVFLHIFTDGRDVGQKTAKKYFDKFQSNFSSNKKVKIASISGRYYGMDRDNNWDRIKNSYDAIVGDIAGNNKFDDIGQYINNNYKKSITDEFFPPATHKSYQGIKDNDTIFFLNFRADRIRQISESIINPDFSKFPTKKINFSAKLGITEYSDFLNKFLEVVFVKAEMKNSLGEVLQNQGLKQLRIAETEKYAHVTFFFSGGREKTFKNEERILINSPKIDHYEKLPEMSGREVTKNIVDKLNNNNFDFILVNYANSDMIGHSGNLESSVKACEFIDKQLKELYQKAVIEKNYTMIITADHGNIENMVDENGNPHTSHTLNRVPFIMLGNSLKSIKLKNGNLQDIAPTILSLMNISIPEEMSGKNLMFT